MCVGKEMKWGEPGVCVCVQIQEWALLGHNSVRSHVGKGDVTYHSVL